MIDLTHGADVESALGERPAGGADGPYRGTLDQRTAAAGGQVGQRLALAERAGGRGSRSSCCSSSRPVSCCFRARSAVCFASADVARPIFRTPVSRRRAKKKRCCWSGSLMPVTRRFLLPCPGRGPPSPHPLAALTDRGMGSDMVRCPMPICGSHDLPLRGSAGDVVGAQAKPLALAETAGVGASAVPDHSAWVPPIPALPRSLSVLQQSLAAFDDELDIRDDRRLSRGPALYGRSERRSAIVLRRCGIVSLILLVPDWRHTKLCLPILAGWPAIPGLTYVSNFAVVPTG